MSSKLPPRFALVRDGVQINYWDDEPPTASQVVEALKANPSTNPT